jgi:cystathionine beta-lyase
MNIRVDFVDFDNEEETHAKLTPRTKLLWLETPTNPTLKVSEK